MDDDQQLRDLLVLAAELPASPLTPPTSLLDRARRRRRVRATSAGLTAVAAAVVAITLAVVSPGVGAHRGTHRVGSSRLSAGVAASAPGSGDQAAVSAQATAAALGRDRWTQLPAAPIAGRSNAAAVWDGREILVWGGASGQSGQQLYADGAGYDPTSRAWTVLPVSPLSARTDTTSVWTGSSLFVWGGLDSTVGSGTYVGDGALYDPASRSWQMLPPAPVSAGAGVQALLVDGEVVLLPGREPSSGRQQATSTAAYDPATNTWRPLAPLPLTPDGQVIGLTSAATGDGITVWETWQRSAQNSTENGTTTTMSGGLAMYGYDLASNIWHREQTTGDGPSTVPQALWTGRQLLLPATERCPPYASCAATTGRSGYALTTSTETWTSIPHGPVDDLDPQSLWTGAALLEFDTGTYTSGPDGTHLPGEAAAWDPTSGTWTRLPDAPYAGSGIATVWTGSQLLLWGPMERADQPNASSGPTSAVGLALGP